MGIFKKLALLIVALCGLSCGAAHAEKRVALVIGNSAYRNVPRLVNPQNDASDVAAALRRDGFETILATDLDKNAMDDATIRFSKEARTADVALFYYSGHALQFEGVNYLAPIDAKLTDEADLRRMVPVNEIVGDLQQAKNLRILVLDSCRDNPLADELRRSIGRSRAMSLQRGLAKIDAPQGMIVAYSTQAGTEAADGDGRNSPYTAAFLKNIEAKEEIATIFRHISADVYEATHHAQLPELSLSVIGDFYLRGHAELTIKPDTPATPDSAAPPPASSPSSGFTGELSNADSDTYFVIRDPTMTRDGPGDEYASKFTLNQDQHVHALGQFEDTEHLHADKLDGVWIKVRSDGKEGFVQRKDALTPEEFEKRKAAIAVKAKTMALMDRAQAARGSLSGYAGIWQGLPNKCIEPTGGLLNAGLIVGLMLNRVIAWSDGNTWHRANITQPDHEMIFNVSSYKTHSIPNVGPVEFMHFAGTNSAVQENLGFKADKMWFETADPKRFGNWTKCGDFQQQRYVVSELLDWYIETSPQRPASRAAASPARGLPPSADQSSTSQSSNQRSEFGAVFKDKKGNFFWSSGASSPGEAEKNASARCSGCERLATMSGSQCFALARANHGRSGAFGWAVRGDIDTAKSDAQGFCAKYSSTCASSVSICADGSNSFNRHPI